MASDPKIDSVNMKVCNDENIHDVKQTFVHDTAASQSPSDLNSFQVKANNLKEPKLDISSKLNILRSKWDKCVLDTSEYLVANQSYAFFPPSFGLNAVISLDLTIML